MRAAAAVRKAAWRATFEPHVYLVTERATPTQITIPAPLFVQADSFHQLLKKKV